MACYAARLQWPLTGAQVAGPPTGNAAQLPVPRSWIEVTFWGKEVALAFLVVNSIPGFVWLWRAGEQLSYAQGWLLHPALSCPALQKSDCLRPPGARVSCLPQPH